MKPPLSNRLWHLLGTLLFGVPLYAGSAGSSDVVFWIPKVMSYVCFVGFIWVAIGTVIALGQDAYRYHNEKRKIK